MAIIALANQKGGVLKTTTAAALWSALPRSLAIDLDVQGNLGLICGANQEPKYDIYDVLTRACSISDAIQELPTGDFIASSIELADIGKLSPVTLRNILEPIKSKYRHLILDCPPALGMVTFNALCATEIVIVPCQADLLSFDGLRVLVGMIDAVKSKVNPNLKIGGLLLTRFSDRSIIRRQGREWLERYATSIGTRVFNTPIRDAVAVLEAQAKRKDIFSYAPKAKVTDDFRAFIAELSEVVEHG